MSPTDDYLSHGYIHLFTAKRLQTYAKWVCLSDNIHFLNIRIYFHAETSCIANIISVTTILSNLAYIELV